MDLKKYSINTFQGWTIIVGFLLLLTSIGLYFFVKNNEDRLISHAMTQQAQTAKAAILDDIETRTEALIRLSNRWKNQQGMPQEAWTRQTEDYMAHMPGTVLMEWTNKGDTVHWTSPAKVHNSHALSRNSRYNKQRKALLKQARLKKTIIMTPMFEAGNGNTYFLFCIPLLVHKQLEGFILAAYHTHTLLSDILGGKLYQNYTIKLSENNKPFYVKKAPDPASCITYSKPYALNIFSQKWHLSLKPNMAAFKAVNFHPELPFLAFLISTMLALLISVILFFVGLLRSRNQDVQKKSQELQNLAHADYLTGLYNRAHFDDSLNQDIAHCKRKKLHFALLYLDLDGFKPVNDRHGHSIGDEILIQVGKRLTSLLREYDPISRIGGDEFAIILHDISDREKINHTAERIIQTISKPYKIANENITISVSIGIARFPEDGEKAKELTKYADKALYKAKSLGKNQVQFWEE